MKLHLKHQIIPWPKSCKFATLPRIRKKPLYLKWFFAACCIIKEQQYFPLCLKIPDSLHLIPSILHCPLRKKIAAFSWESLCRTVFLHYIQKVSLKFIAKSIFKYINFSTSLSFKFRISLKKNLTTQLLIINSFTLFSFAI